MKKIGLILIIFTIIGCSNQESLDVESANKQGILLLDNGTEPQGLDPHIVTGVTEHKIIIALFEGLTMQNPQSLSLRTMHCSTPTQMLLPPESTLVQVPRSNAYLN